MKFNTDRLTDGNKLLEASVVVIIGLILYYVARYIVKKAIFKNIDEKKSSPLRVITKYIKYFYFILLGLVVLKVYGIDVSAMLTGVGIAGIIIGLAVQDALKDIIRGISIISENYYKTGDIIKYKDNTGIVLDLGVKTTKIKDLYTDNIVSIANRNIEQVEIVSNSIYLDIPMPYEVKLSKAEACISEIIEEIKKNEKVLDASYKGVSNLSDSSIDYKLYVSANPKNKLQVRRDTLRVVLEVMDKHKIEVPYNQLDIHNKN